MLPLEPLNELPSELSSVLSVGSTLVLAEGGSCGPRGCDNTARGGATGGNRRVSRRRINKASLSEHLDMLEMIKIQFHLLKQLKYKRSAVLP